MSSTIPPSENKGALDEKLLAQATDAGERINSWHASYAARHPELDCQMGFVTFWGIPDPIRRGEIPLNESDGYKIVVDGILEVSLEVSSNGQLAKSVSIDVLAENKRSSALPLDIRYSLFFDNSGKVTSGARVIGHRSPDGGKSETDQAAFLEVVSVFNSVTDLLESHDSDPQDV